MAPWGWFWLNSPSLRSWLAFLDRSWETDKNLMRKHNVDKDNHHPCILLPTQVHTQAHLKGKNYDNFQADGNFIAEFVFRGNNIASQWNFYHKIAIGKKKALNSQRKNLLPTIAWWFRQMSTGSLRWISRNGRETTASIRDFQTRSCEIFKSCVPVRRMLQNSQMHRHYNIWIHSLTLLNPEQKHNKCIIIIHKHCRTLNLLGDPTATKFPNFTKFTEVN